MSAPAMLYRPSLVLCFVASLMARTAAATAAEPPFEVSGSTAALWPERVAAVYPDGTLGPWIDYAPPAEPSPAAAGLAPIWDSYELNPRFWNTRDNVPHEFYDVPRGSDRYCFGRGFSNRLFWCDPGRPGCERLISCANANGGDLADAAPARATVLSFLWGVRGPAKPLKIEFQIYDTYDGGGCSQPGAGRVSGLVAQFVAPPPGDYRTTLDLVRYGLELDVPDTGRIGIHMMLWEDRDRRVPSDRAYPILWFTKTEWREVMGLDDEQGYSDGHGNKDCVLDPGPNECVAGEPACSNGDGPVGPAVLLLGEGEPDRCIYSLKADSKPRQGCRTCPRKGDRFITDASCETKFDCPMSNVIRSIPCPEGPGSCKKLKGQRADCGTLP